MFRPSPALENWQIFAGRSQAVTLVGRLAERGLTIVIVEHVMRAIMAAARRIIVARLGIDMAGQCLGEDRKARAPPIGPQTRRTILPPGLSTRCISRNPRGFGGEKLQSLLAQHDPERTHPR
jgi:energy-coupling factor transporter ATP-binding protein EcfA2